MEVRCVRAVQLARDSERVGHASQEYQGNRHEHRQREVVRVQTKRPDRGGRGQDESRLARPGAAPVGGERLPRQVGDGEDDEGQGQHPAVGVEAHGGAERDQAGGVREPLEVREHSIWQQALPDRVHQRGHGQPERAPVVAGDRP